MKLFFNYQFVGEAVTATTKVCRVGADNIFWSNCRSNYLKRCHGESNCQAEKDCQDGREPCQCYLFFNIFLVEVKRTKIILFFVLQKLSEFKNFNARK